MQISSRNFIFRRQLRFSILFILTSHLIIIKSHRLVVEDDLASFVQPVLETSGVDSEILVTKVLENRGRLACPNPAHAVDDIDLGPIKKHLFAVPKSAKVNSVSLHLGTNLHQMNHFNCTSKSSQILWYIQL